MSCLPEINIAIVGFGGMGNWHRQTIERIENVHLLGIRDINPAREEYARSLGYPVYESLEAVLDDERVDVVTIAVPNHLHKEIAITAMNAGKNVVCEKPVTLSSADLQEMIDASVKNNVLFTVHQNRRWDEDYLTVKKIYDENKLGRVFNIESRVHGSRGIPGDWRNRPEYGGGMVLDWGVHLLDQVLMMMHEEIDTVYATLQNVTNELVDDGFRVILTYPSGCNVLVEVGTSNFINMPRWYIQGVNGTAVVEDWDINGKMVMVESWESKDAKPIITAAGLTKTMAPRTDDSIKEYPLEKVDADIRDYYRNVAAAVHGLEEPNIKPAQVMKCMKLMEAIFESARTQQVVKFRP